MKDAFIIWITVQLLVIAFAVISIHNEVLDNTYKCVGSEHISLWVSAVVPLAVFVPEQTLVEDYCNNK